VTLGIYLSYFKEGLKKVNVNLNVSANKKWVGIISLLFVLVIVLGATMAMIVHGKL
jgi:hypothetical protein